jgi:hypothetical protein
MVNPEGPISTATPPKLMTTEELLALPDGVERRSGAR